MYDLNDIESMALCAWKEARGEGLFSCFLVLQVIYNRTKAVGFGGPSVHGVVYEKNQFTSMSVPSDPQFNIAPPPDDSLFAAIVTDVPNILAGTNDDPTHGALWYANEATMTSGWYLENIVQSGKHPVTLVYGRHVFRS